MTLKGQARTDYMREYMRRRRAAKKQARPVGSAAALTVVPYLCDDCLHRLSKTELIARSAALQRENVALWRELKQLIEEHWALMAVARRSDQEPSG